MSNENYKEAYSDIIKNILGIDQKNFVRQCICFGEQKDIAQKIREYLLANNIKPLVDDVDEKVTFDQFVDPHGWGASTKHDIWNVPNGWNSHQKIYLETNVWILRGHVDKDIFETINVYTLSDSPRLIIYVFNDEEHLHKIMNEDKDFAHTLNQIFDYPKS